MYLNIINNIKHESKRKSKKIDYLLKQENTDEDNESSKVANYSEGFFYFSIFYGDLTKNWIKLRS